jgi:DNA-directed RNA polymerase specialized sigma24 family protein
METRDLSVEAEQDALLIEIHGLAHRIAKRVVRPRHVAEEVAEDVAQDVVLSCLIRLREGRWHLGDRALDAHIGCLVRRRWNAIRRQRRAGMERDMIFLRDLDASVRPWMDPEAKMDEAELNTLWAATFAKLPRMRRAAYVLVRHRKWSYARAAEKLGITPKGVHSHVVRAQRVFRDALRGRGGVMPPEMATRPTKRQGWRRRRANRSEMVA